MTAWVEPTTAEQEEYWRLQDAWMHAKKAHEEASPAPVYDLEALADDGSPLPYGHLATLAYWTDGASREEQEEARRALEVAKLALETFTLQHHEKAFRVFRPEWIANAVSDILSRDVSMMTNVGNGRGILERDRREMKKQPDEMTVAMQEQGIEILQEEWGEMQVCQYTLAPGTDLSPFFEVLPDGLCPVPHWGRVLEGEIHLRYSDGTEELTRAGEFYHWPAGHTAWTETGVVFIAIQPAEEEKRAAELMAAQQEPSTHL